jgi:hypothetical protein
VPLLIAAKLAFDLVADPMAAIIQWFGVALLSAVGLGHLLACIAQLRRRRPEVSDVFGIRKLSLALERFRADLGALREREAVLRRGRDFINETVTTTCAALCNERDLRGTLMLYSSEREALEVEGVWPPSSDVDDKFVIHLRNKDGHLCLEDDNKGMAGHVFVDERIGYLPNRHFRVAWHIDYTMTGSIEPVRLGDVWKDSRSRRFACVLSSPVFMRVDGKNQGLGVLNLESKQWDIFSDADFHLMEIAAHTFGVGLTLLSDKVASLKEDQESC